MKWIMSVITIVVLLTNIAIAQNDSAFNYFPLDENYFWKYTTTTTHQSYCLTAKMSSFSDRYELFVDDYPYPFLDIIVDSLSGNIRSPQLANIIFDNIRIPPKDSGNIRCDSIKVRNIFTNFIPVRYIRSLLVNNGSSHASAYGLGTISGNEHHPFSIGEPFELQYTFIKGVHYGKALDRMQEDSLLQYHRFNKGDRWIYKKRIYSSLGQTMDSSLVTREALGDSIIEGKIYFGFTLYDDNTKSLSYDFLRYDSTSGNIQQLIGAKEYSYDSLLCTSFTRSTAGSGSMFKVTSSTTELLFGKQHSSRTINEIYGSDIYTSHKSIYGIGLVGFGTEFNIGNGSYNTLVYAKIGGKEYGTNPKKPLLDSLAQYYPLQTGNMWVYSMDGYTNYKIKKVLGDSTLNNKTYKVVESSSLPAATTGLHLERVDTAAGIVYRWLGDREQMLDNMLSPLKGRFDYRQFDSVTTGTVFNTVSSIRYVQELLIPMNPHYRYAYGFGEIYSDYTYENDIPPYPAIVRYNLVFARIDGKDFGLNPLSVEDLPITSPEEFSLSQNYPNPFNPVTVINYQLPTTNVVMLKIYDLLGREVAVLVNEAQNAGIYSVQFNASALASGIYFYHLQAGSFSTVRKMTLIK